MNRFFLHLIFYLQIILLHISFYMFYLLNKKIKYSWIAGVAEISGILNSISKAVNDGASVCLYGNKYYNYSYRYKLFQTSNSFVNLVLAYLYGPVLLGYLVNISGGFIYVWSDGYLTSSIDGRKFEFSFLKKRCKKICCIFCGNDIRSPHLEMQLSNRLGLEVASNYYQFFSPKMIGEKYESKKKNLASSANIYADLVFNFDVDQSSYLSKSSLPFIYFYQDDMFHMLAEKFNESTLKVVHAPSSPIIKGTQLVRAAVKKLRCEGFEFEYFEFINVSNETIMNELKTAHIVLNEFYMFSPGLFGVEALANFCVLMTSADEFIEVSLPYGSNNAWVVTRYYEIYDKLKWLLQNRHLHAGIARSGYSWARENAAHSVSKLKLNKYLLDL